MYLYGAILCLSPYKNAMSMKIELFVVLFTDVFLEPRRMSGNGGDSLPLSLSIYIYVYIFI